VSRRSCYLRAFASSPCSGPLQRAHLIKRQTIRKEVWNRRHELEGVPKTLRVLYADPRSWVWACDRHHRMLDHSRKLKIPRYRLPRELEDFAAQYRLRWWLYREYGV
jgi:hypothetical protein